MRPVPITDIMQGTGLEEWETRAISAKDPPFRAKGDGVVDDTQSLQWWAYAASGKFGFLPAGNYKYTSANPLSFGPNTRILGAGRNICSISAITVNHLLGIATLTSCSEIEGITLNGTGKAGKILFATGSHIAIKNCAFIGNGCNAFGIHVYFGATVQIQDNYLEATTLTPNHQIYVSTGTDISIKNNRVLMTQQIGGAAAIRGTSCSRIQIVSNQATGGNVSVVQTPIAGDLQEPNSAGLPSHDVILSDNIVNLSSGDGISAGSPPGGAYTTNISATGNVVNGSTDYCMSFSLCANVSCIGNTVREASTTGIGILDCYNFSVEGNCCLNNGQNNFVPDGGLGAGINILSGSADSVHNGVISGNVCTDLQGIKTQEFGLMIDGGVHAAQSGITVKDNNFDGNSVAPVLLTTTPAAPFVAQDNGAWLSASASWNPASIANGAKEAKDVTVIDARLGDFAVASFSLDVLDLVLNAQVTANDTVTCVLANNTGGAVDLGAGTVYVKVSKKG